MRHLITTTLMALSLSCASVFAGPAVGGGGTLLNLMKAQGIDGGGLITIDMNNISDIRLRDENIITIQDMFSTPSLNNTFQKAGEGMIMLDMSEQSQVLDVQLMDGSVLESQALLKAFQAYSQNEIYNGGDMGGGSN